MSRFNFSMDDIPREFSVYDNTLRTLEVGSPGKVGILEIELGQDKESSKTIITKQFSKVPLYAQRAIHYDHDNPNMAYIFIISPSGGILQGDRYAIDISLKNNAIANITSQGATRIYKMDANYAIQRINISVDQNCYLEFIPDQIIPYKNSRYFQQVTLRSHDDATLVYSEVVTPGRVAMGEFFSFDILYLKTRGISFEGDLKFIDSQLMEPKKNNFTQVGILNNYTIFGSIYIITKKEFLSDLNKKINEFFANTQTVMGGSSFLPENSGIIVRILGNLYDDLKTTIYEILKIIRKIILGTHFTGIRKS